MQHIDRRFIGRVVLVWNGEHLPTDFFLREVENDRAVFVAETAMPDGPQTKIISCAERLLDLLHQHRRKVETMRSTWREETFSRMLPQEPAPDHPPAAEEAPGLPPVS